MVNFELPNVPEDYVHRIGRTGRAGASGKAVSLVCSDEIDLLNDVQQLIQTHIPREIIAGFEPFNFLIESRPLRPVKANKPRKPKTEHQDGQRSADNARGHKPKSKNPRNKADGTGNRNPNPGGRRKNPAGTAPKSGSDPYSASR